MRAIRMAFSLILGGIVFVGGCASDKSGDIDGHADYKAFGEYDTYYPVGEQPTSTEEPLPSATSVSRPAPAPQPEPPAPTPSEFPNNPFSAGPSEPVVFPGQSPAPVAQASASMQTAANSPLRPAIISRSQWGSTPDEAALAEKAHTPTRITLHHAGVRWESGFDPPQKLRDLQAWGRRDKGWPDIPYHFMIAPDGRIYEGRDVQYEPETNTNYDTTGHIGVHLWGNFDVQRATEPQLKAAVDTIAWLSDQYEIDPSTIAGHNDVPGAGATSCPGKDFDRYIEQGLIEQWVRQKLAGETPQITLLAPASDGPNEFVPN